jgi:uncharacterized membrane protein YdbT with pleckstrin-like domain
VSLVWCVIAFIICVIFFWLCCTIILAILAAIAGYASYMMWQGTPMR